MGRNIRVWIFFHTYQIANSLQSTLYGYFICGATMHAFLTQLQWAMSCSIIKLKAIQEVTVSPLVVSHAQTV